jgi:hypothetical protein
MEMQKRVEIPHARDIGRCIYCGSTKDLTDEHILPFGLKGPWVLHKASCSECCKITSAFEREVLRKQFLLARAALGLPTRHKKNRPEYFSFEVTKNGVKSTLTLPVSDCPPVFIMLVPEQPRYIREYPYKKGVTLIGSTIHGPPLNDIKEKLGIDSISFTGEFPATSFERMLAKIAFGMTILNYGPDALQECYVLPCIVGKTDDVGYWVGSSERDVLTLPKETEFHRIDMLKKNDEIGVSIRLFANYATPEYLVIVGKLKGS